MNQDNITILVVDDEEEFRTLLRSRLSRKGYHVFEAADGRKALEIIEAHPVDVVLLDLRMPEMDGMTFLEKNKRSVQVIVLTGHGSVETAIEAMKKGAYDYLTKPYNMKELEALIEKASEKSRLTVENQHLKDLMRTKVRERGIIAESPFMKEILFMATRVAKTDSPVLLLGESGTGKEVLAQFIYEESLRNNKPFIPINMGAIPETVLESELFGHEKGAFTGAMNQKKGLFELADGGTLFLDEIGDMPLPLQVKLLRFLEAGEYRRVGGNQVLKVNVRIIAATNVNLEEKVALEQFRSDLYYRLHVFKIEIPPLRERREDILPLAHYFLAKYDASKVFSEEAVKALLQYHYPGNIRELSHMIERGCILAPEKTIKEDHIFSNTEISKNKALPHQIKDNLFLPLREIERQYILQVLDHTEGNKKKAADILGISVRNLYRKLNEYEGEA
ncbi:sigma-54 dependent transcriptional regulator [Microaerobacter geothermalis]|uniref:sigma-54-dependent transcriptional regulator n=1 Tax=Microaerobacter geothermalis TaxID=674972 RepID=UPI001F3F8E0B|nr:sigma-54 dependent transcriptional regulator [Microaerobacter geothermalis]MCF6092480.1 sigma-54 dependent transcriptional regulator [Microaerobacter geothermalis]